MTALTIWNNFLLNIRKCFYRLFSSPPQNLFFYNVAFWFFNTPPYPLCRRFSWPWGNSLLRLRQKRNWQKWRGFLLSLVVFYCFQLKLRNHNCSTVSQVNPAWPSSMGRCSAMDIKIGT